MAVLLALWLAFILSLAMTPIVLRILKRQGHIKKNYLGLDIPTSCGISLVLSAMMAILLGYFFGWLPLSLSELVVPLFLVSSAAFAGLVDDIWGTQSVKGFRGHLGSLIFARRLSTGTIKAIVIFASSAIVATAISSRLIEAVVNTFILALSANMWNLLDLRPGRAIKAYFIVQFPVSLLTSPSSATILAFSVLGAALAYLPAELKERGMLGDTGSNALGISIGYLIVLNLGLYPRIIYLMILLLMHLYCEKYSLSRLIERNPVMRFLDQLGRR